MLAQGKLPRSFGVAEWQPLERLYNFAFRDDRWAHRANEFRELVEPFDIANYYRLDLDRYSGHYAPGSNRPTTYARLDAMWREYCATNLDRNYNSSLAWAEAAKRACGVVDDALPSGSLLKRAPPPVDTPVGRLPVLVLRDSDLPLERVAVKRDATLDDW